MTGKLKNILITRPKEDSVSLLLELSKKGFDVTSEPMLTINYHKNMEWKLDKLLAKNPVAVLITSANGVRALADLTTSRDVQIIAVGKSSAEIAEKVGFWHIESAAGNENGDVNNLLEYISSNHQRNRGIFLHVSPRNAAGNLVADLNKRGFIAESIVLYDASPVEAISSDTISLLANGSIDAVLFYSSRTAKTFISLAEKAGVTDNLRDIVAVCLSEKIKKEAMSVSWGNIYTAETPDNKAIISVLEGA